MVSNRDFMFTEDQLEIKRMINDFIDREVLPRLAELDEGHKMPWDLYYKMCDMGIQCISCPEEYGGPAFDAVTSVIVSEAFGRGDRGIYGYCSANSLAAHMVMAAGNDEQKKMFFDIVNNRKLASFALTEPNSGSDSASITTTARREGDEYVLNGTKCFITNASYSSIFVVLATIDRSLGAKGITAFLVERDRPGLSSGKEEDKMGVRSSNTAELVLQDVRIPVSNRLGDEGGAFKYTMHSLTMGRITLAAGAVGGAQSALDHAIAYAKERVQFGKPIGKFQGIQFMLADMDMQIEAARALVYNTARLVDAGHDVTKEAAICKALATDTTMKVVIDAAQIFGGYGYMKDYPMEKMIRDAKIGQVVEGTNQIQRTVIARQLLGRL